MKQIITALLLVSSIMAFAQNNSWCGSEMPESYRAVYRMKDRSDYLSQSGHRAGIRWIPVFYHIVAKTDGSGGADLKPVFESHCELNEAYNVFDIGFFIAGIDTVKSTSIWNHTNQSAGWTAFSTYNIANVCNVYVNGNLPGLCGYATFPHTGGNGGGIFMNVACIGKNTMTLHHEMGHYLGLPHTFDDSDGKEFVDGTNCSTAGDLFCDTPADFLDDRTPCPYNGSQTDPHGDLYSTVIDETLIMSYFLDACVNRFSTMQQVEMNDVLTNDRPNLLNQALPDMSNLPATTFLSPRPADTTLLSNNVTFRWNSIPNAAYYLFTLQSSTSSVLFADTLLTDTTFFAANLSPNKTYKYKLRGISYGNTCSTGNPFTVVKTSAIKAAVAVVPSCSGQTDAEITLTPSNGVAPYTLLWSEGSTGNTVQNLAPGTYTVTITDANGEVGTAVVTVPNPPAINVNISKTGSDLNASGNGGTPPYTYTWSNGTNGSLNNNIAFGNYSVTVTDAQGCSTSQDFVFSSIGVDMDLNVAMRVFPNPASSSLLNVEVQMNEKADATVSLVNMSGEIIKQLNKELVVGQTSMRFDISTLPSGIYLVQVKTAGSMTSQRVSVVR